MNAGNAVYGFGNYFGDGGDKVCEVISNHGNNIYFTINMNLWDLNNDATLKRGTHTYCSDYTAGSGHWQKLPVNTLDDDQSNLASRDEDYFTTNFAFTNDSAFFKQDTNNSGTSNWHTNWLKAITNGTDGTNLYNNMFSWYLMDEPYRESYDENPGRRDCYTNHHSVHGHYNFCCLAEGASTFRPKMVDVIKGVRDYINSNWNDLSSYINILCGNEYGMNYTTPRLWYNANMAAWCYSKISGDSSKMAMAWLPGCLDAYDSSYVFYGSIIEGARGVLWWMEEFPSPHYWAGDHSNYTHQQTVYGNFTNTRTFKSGGGSKPSDETVILNGSSVSLAWTSNDTNGFTTPPGYPKMISNNFCALAMKYSSRYRLYVVNHASSTDSFIVGINTNEIYDSNWSNAYDMNGTNHVMTPTHPSLDILMLSDSLPANTHMIYDIGAGN